MQYILRNILTDVIFKLILLQKLLLFISKVNKMLSYRRETALQGTLVLAESGRLELPTLTLTLTVT